MSVYNESYTTGREAALALHDFAVGDITLLGKVLPQLVLVHMLWQIVDKKPGAHCCQWSQSLNAYEFARCRH